MNEKKVDLELRRKVAKLDGWDTIGTGYGNELRGFNVVHSLEERKEAERGGYKYKIPMYEISIDEIAEACDQHNIGFVLSGFVDDKDGCKYDARHTSDDIDVSGRGLTRAIAVCYLFLMVMKERSLQKDRAMERDLLGRKIAEEAVALASQHPDSKQARSNLDLRQKVATFVGWTDFYRGAEKQGLWGVPPLGASTTDTTVPRYELDTAPIIGALISSDIRYERLTLLDHIDVPAKNLVYVDRNTSITACGETSAIALCNLFVAVMESRLAERNFSLAVGGVEGEYTNSTDQKPLVREELVKIESPFTRHLLQHIREKANWQAEAFLGRNWMEAHLDISRAVDRLDAMLARKELVEVKWETPAEE